MDEFCNIYDSAMRLGFLSEPYGQLIDMLLDHRLICDKFILGQCCANNFAAKVAM